jgi:trehalose 6-phosphate synthase/phosphatase
MHVPIASPELLQSIPNAKEILTSLAALDLLGLQIKRDVINLKECYKALGIKPPRIKHFPIGIDYQAYHKAVQKAVVKLKNPEISDQKVILSVSRLDYTKGILNQLRAVDKLFSDHPQAETIYKLVVSPSREGLQEYRQLKKDIDQLVSKINKRHGHKIINYEYRNFNFAEMVSSYRQADVLLINPVSDGMNLIAKEYIAARDHPGTLVLSKTTGAAQQLSRALQVDSDDIPQITTALNAALNMPVDEKKKRWVALQKNVRQQDVFHWADKFLKSLDTKQGLIK